MNQFYRFCFSLSFALLFSGVGLLFSQNPLQKQWDYRFGGANDEILTTFQQTSDGGFILGGASSSDSSGDKTQHSRGGYDFWIVKTDGSGNKLWDHRFGGSNTDRLTSLQQTSDGGYILGGTSLSDSSGDRSQHTRGNYDYWIVRTDAAGNKLWDKRFGGSGPDNLYSIRQTLDGGFILGGSSLSDSSGDKMQHTRGSFDYWVVKTDSTGNLQWERRFGGSSVENLYALIQTHDGGYLLGGYSISDSSGDKTQDNRDTGSASINRGDYWLVRLDSSGSKLWDKRFGGTHVDYMYSLSQTIDNGFILGGFSSSDSSGDKSQQSRGSTDYWMVKIDSAGNKLWDRRFGGTDHEDDFGSIAQTTDNGFFLTGTSYSGISGDKSEDNLSVEQIWMVRTDSAGNLKWDKTVFNSSPFDDESGFGLQSGDGCYVVANWTYAGVGGYKTQPSRGGNDFWMAKFCDTTMVPLIHFNAVTTAFCHGSCIDFLNQTLYATSYQWNFDGATPPSSTDANPTGICYPDSGHFDVTLIATNGYGSDTLIMHQYVTVFPSPLPFAITQHADSLLAPQGFVYYQWYRDTVPMIGSTGYYFVPTQNGTYYVQVRDTNGCGIAAAIVVVSVGMDHLAFAAENLEVFPNPSSGSFRVSFESRRPLSAVKIHVTNALDETIRSKEIVAATGKNEIDFSDSPLAPGIYIVKVYDGDSMRMKKLVIQK